MSTPDTWYAYVAITGSFDPMDISQKIGMSPTHCVRIGEPGRYSKAAKCSRWELRSRLEITDPLENHVRDVLDQLDTMKSGFEQLIREFDGAMQLVCYFKEQVPGIHFDKETVLRIAQYALSIDCDFYNRA